MPVEKAIKFWTCWEETRIKYKLSCCINPDVVFCSAPWNNHDCVSACCEDGCWTLRNSTQFHSRKCCDTQSREHTPLKDCQASFSVLVVLLPPVNHHRPSLTLYMYACEACKGKQHFSWRVESFHFSAIIKLAFRLTSTLKSKLKCVGHVLRSAM